MNKRQKEVQQAFLDDEKKVLKKLEKNYQDALDEINSKIELLMARQDADMQHVIYQVEYQRALKTQVQSILEALQANEFETVSEYLANSYHDGFIGTMYDLQGQGIPLIFPIDQEAVVAAVQQDTKLSEPLYTAMGKDITDLKKKITGEISRGLSSGQMYGEISRNIASWANIPKNNAMRIARTEAHRIQCKATADAQFRAKEKGADVVKQWDASLDAKTRDSHVKVDGEIRELDEKFSNGLRYPGDPSGGAEEVINCRCALLQRARWALGNDYTKWSADAPIVIDDEGTTQFAIIDSKSFKEFKGYYMDATRQMTMNFEKGASSRVRSGEQKIKGKITILSEYTVNGVTYTVDNKHVLAKSTERERKVAELLSEEFGKEVLLVPRIVYPQGISTPDYIIDGEKYDLKAPTGISKHVLYNMVNSKKRQADNFVFDISNNPQEFKALEEDIQYIFNMPHTSFVKKIVVIKDGKIIKTYKK